MSACQTPYVDCEQLRELRRGLVHQLADMAGECGLREQVLLDLASAAVAPLTAIAHDPTSWGGAAAMQRMGAAMGELFDLWSVLVAAFSPKRRAIYALSVAITDYVSGCERTVAAAGAHVEVAQ